MARHHHGIGLLATRLLHRRSERHGWISRLGTAEELGRKPVGQAWGDEADDRDPKSPDLPHRPRQHPLPGAVEAAGHGSTANDVRGEHGRCRAIEERLEFLGAPVKVVVTERPGVVAETIEEIDQQCAAALEAHRRTLHHITHVDGEGMWRFTTPLADAGGAPRKTADIVEPFVGARGYDAAVEIGGVEDRHGAGAAEIGGQCPAAREGG